MWPVKWLTWLAADPSTGRTDFDSRSIHTGFVTDKSSIGTYFYPIPRFYPVDTIPLMLHTHISFTYYGGSTGCKVRGSNTGGGDIFRTCPDRPWAPSSLLYNGYRAFTGGKERPGRDADPSPPSSAVVMKE